MRRCGLFAVFSVALSVACSTLFFDVSKAQSEYDSLIQTTTKLEICKSINEDCADYSTDWLDQYLEALNKRGGVYKNAADEITSALVDGHDDFLIYTNGRRINLIFAPASTVKIKFAQNQTVGAYIYLEGDVRHTQGFTQNSTPHPLDKKYYTDKGANAGHLLNNVHVNSANSLILKSQNTLDPVLFYANTFDVVYPENYKGDVLPGGTVILPENPYDETVRCDWHDVGCWFSKVGDTVVDSITTLWDGVLSLFEGLIEFLASIFIPGDDNILVKAFADLNEYMTNKLGFLLYPVDFLNSVIRPVFNLTNSLDKNEVHCDLTDNVHPGACTGVCAPNVLGDQGICLRIGELETRFPQLWTTMIWFLRVTLVVSMIELLRRKYMQIVSN